MSTAGPLDLQYVRYDSSKETQYLSAIRQLISKDLSEPYSIYVYRYFLYQWGDLCFMVKKFIFSFFIRAFLRPLHLFLKMQSGEKSFCLLIVFWERNYHNKWLLKIYFTILNACFV